MNTLLKKCLSVILAVVMLCMIAVPVFAESVDKTPVVVIPGVLNTPIIRENGEQVLLPDFSNLSNKQIEELINTLKYILKLQDSKDYSGATTKLIDLLYEYLDGAACNADGTSKYPTHVIKNYNNYNTDSRANESIGREVSKYIGKENVYVFTYDWRGEIINIVDNELAPFIEKIKADTGAKQVKIACVSMGGAVTSAYLNRYGDRNDVKKVVFVSSAAKGVEFVSKKEAIDTTTPTGKFMLTVFGAVAELEREYILQRQKEGISAAKEQGKYTGRKRNEYTDLDRVLDKWRGGKITATAAMKELGMSRSTFYRRVRESMSV